MDIKYEYTEAVVPNTTMQKMLVNGVHKTYIIKAMEGYDLHDIVLSNMLKKVVDDNGLKKEELCLQRGYTSGSVSYGANNGFEQKTIDVDGVPTVAYGDREFFTVKKGED